MFKGSAIPAWVLGSALTLLPAGAFARDRDDYRDDRSYHGDSRDYPRGRHAEHEYREHARREWRERERREREWREHERREYRYDQRYYGNQWQQPGYYDSYGYWHPRY